MIWLRLLIAVIALTISSDLSAWAQPQMQVNSPEGFYDCKGIANGANDRDINQVCCLPSDHTYEPHCGKCYYTKQGCEPQFGCDTLANKDINGTCCFDNQKVCGKCYYTKQGCESQRGCGNIDTVCGRCGPMQGCESVRGCGNIDTVCGSCTGTMGGCGRCSGCKDCKTFRCSYTKGSYWPMFHNTGTNCGSAFELPNNHGGPVNLGHGTTFYRVDLFSQPPPNEEKKCYPKGRLDPATCADTNKSGWIYATNIAGEKVSIEEERGKKSCTCNDGTITCN